MQLSGADVPLSKDIDFEIATYKDEVECIIVNIGDRQEEDER